MGGGTTSTLSAVVPPGARGNWLIAGTRSFPTGLTSATVWTSPDGANWSRFALPKPTGESSTSARAATNWGNQVVVVGSAGTGATMTAQVWISQGPGEPFVAVPQSPSFLPPAPTSPASSGQSTGAVMDTVAGGALGLFAAGTINGRATIWYSTGGRNWQVLSGASSEINRFHDAVVNTVLASPGGIFAAGSYWDGNRLSGELWSSSDGIHWANDGGWFAGGGDRVITSLVDMRQAGTTEPGMLAVGGVREGSTWQPASWISPNGYSWSQTSLSFPLDDEPSGSLGALVYAATGSDGRLLAVGGSPGRQRVWQSTAGLSWSSVPLPPGASTASGWHLGLVAASDHVVVAADNLPGQPYVLVNDGVSWHEPSAAPGAVFGRPLAVATPTGLLNVNGDGHLVMSVQVSKPGLALGTGETYAAVLSSLGGRSWALTNGHAFGGEEAKDLLPVPAGLLAVGSAVVPGPAVAGGKSTAAWAKLSPNGGVSWPDELISSSTLGEPGGPASAVTAGRVGDSEYVVGQAGPEAVDWYSPDGSFWEPPRPLDASPQLSIEHPLGSCFAGNSAVVVGSLTSTARGSLPAFWSSTDGSSWTAGTFSPLPPAGWATTVEGCLSTGTGFIAYGGTSNGASEQPLLWGSSDGVNWQQMSSSFTTLAQGAPGGVSGLGAGTAPLDAIEYGTSTWLGLSGQGDLPSQVWPAAIGGAAGAIATPAGLWSSFDAGSNWQQVATAAPSFGGALFSQVDAAVSVGQEVVLAGEVDGRLRVWLGTPTSTSTGS